MTAIVTGWRERIAFRRAELERRLAKVESRVARRVLLGELPKTRDEEEIRYIRSRLLILKNAVAEAEEIEAEESPW